MLNVVTRNWFREVPAHDDVPSGRKKVKLATEGPINDRIATNQKNARKGGIEAEPIADQFRM